MPDVSDTVAELVTRPGHEKVRTLVHHLLVDGLNVPSRDIDFERREVRGRIDALLGRTVIEFKSDLRSESGDAEDQLIRYLRQREQATGQRYVGLATDGATFSAYELASDETLRIIGQLSPLADHVADLLVWLQSVLAVGDQLAPEPEAVRRELGRDSPAYRRAQGELQDFWAKVARLPDVQVKRKLWDDHLQHVYGTRVGGDDLFLQHTYLTIIAKTMATSVLGVVPTDAEALLSGAPFEQAGISGAVESDFFDWILSASGGDRLVTRLARQVGRFRLSDVEHDVLKGLYESLIDPEQRHDLGEYYTPDWLAAWMCERAIEKPLDQRVLDPACGSGTFLFHAIRRYIAAADTEGRSSDRILVDCTAHVLGIDVHPVAVAIARVTYLLAIGEDMLRNRPARLTVPVYLGDSLQWNTEGFFGKREVRVQVPDGPVLLFPTTVAEDSARFDATVQAMIDYSDSGGAPVASYRGWLRQNGVTDQRDVCMLEKTYADMVMLRATGRDHIWGYVLRNLSRPFALSASERRADVIVGNPPWLSYRYMATDMQARFREECVERRLWVGGRVATHQDLSAYFFARAAELYLKDEGTIAFVMPRAALTRQQFRTFRSQQFGRGRNQLVRFEEVWDFDGVQLLFRVPSCSIFPVPSCSIFARKRTEGPRPETVISFHGELQKRDANASEAAQVLRRENSAWPGEGERGAGSPYAGLFHQGATVVPRMLWLVERAPAGRFGTNPEAPFVRSRRSRQENEPWRTIDSVEGNVERIFLWRLLLGPSVVPFRLLQPVEAVIPWDSGSQKLINSERARSLGFTGLSRWLSETETLWSVYRRGTLSLLEQIDYYGKLSAQLPVPEIRVVYAASGTLPVAAILSDEESLIEHALYWALVQSIEEGRYLTAILNSEVLRTRIADRQARGQWGARHFDTLLVNEPIPRFNGKNSLHREIVRLASHAQDVSGDVSLSPDIYFVTARRRIREALANDGVSTAIDNLVGRLLA